ncbi:hypothetical protein N0B31_12205 [Salinirubellus salinus]|uniref:Helix-turn-helix domain-containing protein n=1 Tax=Salinirubellus salinus TaxID=1364945 RepID=A0A9E7QZI5_9EURY|nr:hypothetical protein [Salinirubellus salinus]UWM52911.1 hypothetical protein N0B31_12205 [Salinirubellus salinus]
MRPGLPSTLTLVLVLVLAGVAGGVGTAATAPVTDTRADVVQVDPPRNGTLVELQLTPDGTARWTVEQRFALDDENDTRAFERLANEFEAGDAGTGYLEAFARGRVAASNATGREMRLVNISRDSRVEAARNVSVGVLELSFEWTNFARVGGGRLRVDDAFRTPDNGTWFPGITESETFVVRPPAGYGVSSAPAAPTRGVIRLFGPREFEPGYLDITYERLATPTETPTVTAPGGTLTGSGTPSDTPTVPPTVDRETLFLLVGLVGLGLLAVLVYLLARRGTGDDGGAPAAANGGVDDGGAIAAGVAGGESGDGEPEPEPAPEPEPEPVDTELLSDEERVEHLLEWNGGRMKQANIVDETGWSNAKVSQLLSAMDEAGRIDKLRIGRENLISLPDEDVTEFEE